MATFDDKAKEWEKNPLMVERALILAKEIKEFIKPNKTMTALDFGCGTGLLSFFLKDTFKNITLTDTSEGMLEVLKNKIKTEGIENFNPLKLNLTNNEYLKIKNKFDVIYTSMTLHHIDNIDDILKKFYALLNNKGYIAIADLDKEDGRFHSHLDEFKGHLGFEKGNFENLLIKNGFIIKKYKTIMEIEKTFDKNEIKKYPVFLLFANKQKNK